MPIKDKDGKVYRLRGPNPLLKEHVEWDRSKMKLFNLGWKSEVVTDERNPVKAEQETIVDIGKVLNLKHNKDANFIRAKDFIEEVRQPVAVEPKTVVLDVDPNIARLLKERGVAFYCAPAIGFKEHNDPLYGSSYQTTQFGDQFVFDAIILDESGLQLQFWCVRAISKGSIVYQKKNDGMTEGNWWRVERLEEKTGGYLVLANPSDLNPDFS